MGFAPHAVDQMTLWEFEACYDGFRIANGAEDEPDAPSYQEHLEMLQKARAL